MGNGVGKVRNLARGCLHWRIMKHLALRRPASTALIGAETLVDVASGVHRFLAAWFNAPPQSRVSPGSRLPREEPIKRRNAEFASAPPDPLRRRFSFVWLVRHSVQRWRLSISSRRIFQTYWVAAAAPVTPTRLESFSKSFSFSPSPDTFSLLPE